MQIHVCIFVYIHIYLDMCIYVSIYMYKYICAYICVDAPWCGHCRQLEPVYSEAAGLLKADSGVRFAKVDATEEEELGAEFHISSFPMLKLFTYGDRHNPITYTGTTP